MNTRAVVAICMGVVLLTSACAASNNAGRLASITSSQLQTLNSQTQQYVATVNESRNADALRVASAQAYFRSIDALALEQVRAWQAYPDDPSNKNKIEAYSALQTSADIDMANSESDTQAQSSAVAALAANYGQLSYSPSALTAVVAQLQALSSKSEALPELHSLYDFSSGVIADAKSGLAAAKLNPAGVSKATSP